VRLSRASCIPHRQKECVGLVCPSYGEYFRAVKNGENSVDAKVIDWAEFTDEEIERFILELTAERKKRGEEKRRALKKQIENMVKEHGVSLVELFPQAGKDRSLRREKRKRGDQTVKYRNPAELSQTWSGIGRKPAWLIEALASGKTLEDFAV
jgi:DNA-binding protein H-NS